MVIFGATVVTTKKLQFQQLVLGIDGTIHPFRKPCLQVMMLNISELGSLIAFGLLWLFKLRKSHKTNHESDQNKNLLNSESEQNPTEQIRRNFITRIRNNYTCMLFIRMLLPAILDICTGISA
ncbi:MAG: hypothetical protein EZS28_050989, partial [Streblomastix strix]